MVCSKCKQDKSETEFYKKDRKYSKDGVTSQCKVCIRKSQNEYSQQHKLEINNRLRIWRKDNPEKEKSYRREIKRKVFDHYGWICKCCGESEIAFLTIDHVNNDGAKCRKTIGYHGGKDFYLWLTKNNFPEGFQTLCMNCNFARGKRNGDGICPHQKETYLDRIGW